MQNEIINTLSTAVIAFVTTLGSMFGFYYNLSSDGVSFLNIAIFELLFIIALWQFVIWIRGGINGQKE